MDFPNAALLGGLFAVITLCSTFGKQIVEAVKSMQKIWLAQVTLNKTLASAIYIYAQDNMKMLNWRSRLYMGCRDTIKKTQKEYNFE